MSLNDSIYIIVSYNMTDNPIHIKIVNTTPNPAVIHINILVKIDAGNNDCTRVLNFIENATPKMIM